MSKNQIVDLFLELKDYGIKTDRIEANYTYEELLNKELYKRGLSEKYHFGICERTEHEYSRYLNKKFTYTYWNLALYKTNGIFGERIEQIYGRAIDTDEDYDYTIVAIIETYRKIKLRTL